MRYVLMLILFAVLLTSCAPQAAPTPPADPNAPEVREVSMRLQWFLQWQFAGYIVAQAKGYYADEGLDVTLHSGGPDLVPLPLVTAGRDTFGSTGADTVLLARERDIPVVALATWFQASPVAFMVHADSGIAGPQDFPGRTVGMFYGDNVETEYLALLAATGVDRRTITEVPGDYSLAPFLQRRVEVWPVYATDQPNTARREGAEVDLIVARDYGVNLMGDTLFTTEEFARQNPRTVRAFVAATLRGWEEAVANPEAAIDLILEVNNELEREQLAFEAYETITLLRYGPGARCLGYSDPNVWAEQAALMQQLGLLQNPPDLEAALYNDPLLAAHATQGITSCDR
ncbi:MAG: ABC transporter substrate-binding protein [Oscillochloridaceae bacterium umkhey_bin13]